MKWCRLFQFLFAAVCLLLCGCAGRWGGGTTNRIVEEILKSHGKEFIWETTKWTVLGAVLGLIVALAAFFGLRALGAYRWEWKHARWMRVLTLVTMLALCTLFAGTIGFFHGVWRGTDVVLHKSQLATEVFPRIGEVAADVMAIVHLYGTDLTEPESVASNGFAKAEIEAFRAGAGELDVPEFLRRLDGITDKTMQQVIDEAKQRALGKFPQWKGRAGERILNWFLDMFGKALVKKTVQDQLGKRKWFKLLQAALDGLPAEAARAGSVNTIARNELSAYFVREALIPSIQLPIRAFVRSQQITVLVLALLTIAVPPMCFRVAEMVRSRGVARSTAAGPPPQTPG